MTTLGNRLTELRPLWVAAIFYVAVHAGDFISTSLCMAYVPDSSEANIFLRDSETLKFIPMLALELKTLYAACLVIPLTVGIYVATKNAIMASIPMWFLSWVGLGAVYQNFALLVLYGAIR